MRRAVRPVRTSAGLAGAADMENTMKFRFSYLRIQSDGAPIFKFVRHRNFSILVAWRLCFEFSTPITYRHGLQWW